MMMPTLHAYASGASGRTHSDEFEITDWQLDVIDAGKAMASTVIDLLADDGINANDIIANFEAQLSQEKYLETLRGFQRSETWNSQ